MSAISESIAMLKQASIEQTKSSQDLALKVAGMMSTLENKADESINNVESHYESAKSQLTIIARDAFKDSVEKNSGGRNTVLYDAQGNPNIMMVLPAFKNEDLGFDSRNFKATDYHRAFNNVHRRLEHGCKEILIAKYLASATPTGTAVVGGALPIRKTFYEARQACETKGDGWHLLSCHEWGALSLYALANGTQPRGNTLQGISHEKKWESGRVVEKIDSEIKLYSTLTGSGPVTWSHDASPFGVFDLVGNVSEWVDQMKLEEGELILTSDNCPDPEPDWFASQVYFDTALCQVIEPGNPNILCHPKISDKIVNKLKPVPGELEPYMQARSFKDMENDMRVRQDAFYQQLLLQPVADLPILGGVFLRNYGTRYAARGGSSKSGTLAGLAYLNFMSGGDDGTFAFRPAFFT